MKRTNLNEMSLDNLQTKLETLSETSLYSIQGGEWVYVYAGTLNGRPYYTRYWVC